MKHISPIIRTVIIILLVFLTMSVVGYLIETKPVVETAEGERALRAVVVIESEPLEVHRRTVGYGIADAIFHADVSARVSSLVTNVPPSTRSGTPIRKGELIVELDSTDFEQLVIKAEQAIASEKATQHYQSVERKSAEERARIAREDFRLAELELSRILKAFESGAANQREIDIAKQKSLSVESSAINAKELSDKYPSLEEQTSSRILSLEADLVIAQENLRRCFITSPIDGVLQEIDVRVGEHVVNGMRIARIVNTKVLEIPLRLPSHARSFVHVGDSVSLSSAGFGLRTWHSKISRIAPEDETKSRTMIAYVDLSQHSNSLDHIPPGLFLRAEVVDNFQPIMRWVVPRRAIKEDRIMVVRDKVLHSIPIIAEFSIVSKFEQFNVPDEDWVVLQTQLKEGDLVAVDQGVSLRDGMHVRPISTSKVDIE